MNWDATIWFVLMVAFLVVEAACPVHLVSVWFAAGALAAAAVGLFHGMLWLQITVFIVVSGALLASLWPLTKRFLRSGKTRTNVESVPGTEGYVLSTVDNRNATGQVKLGPLEWTARSTDGHIIQAGTLVRVDRVEGVKVFVSPVKEEVQV